MSDELSHTSYDTAGAPASEPEPHWTDSAAGRLVGVLAAPKRTFESISRRPTWVLALVVLVLAALGSQYLVMSQPGMAEFIRDQAAAQGNEITVEQAQTYGKVQMGCSVLIVPAFYAILGLLLWGLISMFGGKASFHKAMAIATHAMIPQLVAGLLTILVLVSGGGDFDPLRMQLEGGILTSNLAFLAPADAAPALVILLSTLDVFTIWSVILLVLGVTLVGGISTAAGVSLVGALWVVWLLFRIGTAMLGQVGGGG